MSHEILHIFAHQPLSAFTGLQEARKKNNREYRNTIYGLLRATQGRCTINETLRCYPR